MNIWFHNSFFRQVSVLLCSLSMLATATGAAAEQQARQEALFQLTQDIRAEFADIPHWDLPQLQQHLSDVVLIDVREPKEFAVSRIPGAHNITERSALAAFVRQQDKPVVLYCSVGWRSAELTAYLHELNQTQVVNFAGSIFAWGNSGGALEDELGPVKRVHPYNWFWGWRYLSSELHATKARTSDALSK